MHIGVCMFNTDYAIRIEELARAAEERRFESLFVPEHTHIPASRRTPFPSGGELPREYSHTLDPFVALAHAAAVTTQIRLGTGICLIIERDTSTTAKEGASVDFVSNGRVLFGIGGGGGGAGGPRGARHEDDLRLRLRRQARGGRARPARGGRRDARNSQVAVGAARPGAAAPGSVRQARPVSLDLPAWAAELLRESRVARLGTADRAGRPLVVPVCYAFDGRACFSAIDAKRKRVAGRDLRRVRNIEQNPHVSLVVDRYDEDWARLAWVIVDGRG